MGEVDEASYSHATHQECSFTGATQEGEDGVYPKIEIESKEQELAHVGEIDRVEDESGVLSAFLVGEELVDQRRDAD